MRLCCLSVGLVMLAVAIFGDRSSAQPTSAGTSPQLPPVPADCGALASSGIELAPLPNATRAIKERKGLRLLAIGGTSVAGLDADAMADQDRLQQQLGRLAPGLRIEVVNRGVSGELVADAAERLKNEVALNEPDLVLWQVGTADALARIPVSDFEAALTEAVRWLKFRRVDVILAGTKYSRQAADDEDYQAIRQSVFRVARQENVPRISQWQVGEAVEKAQENEALPADEYELSEERSFCVAQYVGRMMAASIFGLGAK